MTLLAVRDELRVYLPWYDELVSVAFDYARLDAIFPPVLEGRWVELLMVRKLLVRFERLNIVQLSSWNRVRRFLL